MSFTDRSPDVDHVVCVTLGPDSREEKMELNKTHKFNKIKATNWDKLTFWRHLLVFCSLP